MFCLKKNLCNSLIVLLIFQLPLIAQDKIAIGETKKLFSKVLQEDRTIQIYLPPSYGNKKIQEAHYPVIYLLDGESHFHYLSGFIDKLSQGPYASIPEMIVVGIVNTNRSRDLTPTATIHKQTKKLDTINSGGNEAFISFVQKELSPFIENNYRTENYKILIGHSYGGITALNILLHHTKMFDAYLVHDPSIWYDHQVILKQFEASVKTDLSNRRLFLTQAGERYNNTELNDHFTSNKKFQVLLGSDKFQNLQWQFRQYENEDHGSIPITGNLDGLRYIFKGHQIDIKAVVAQPDLIKNAYAKLSEDLNFPFLPTESYMEKVARYLMRIGHGERALDYLEQNLRSFPKSPQAHYSLYEYFDQIHQKEKAQTYLSRAIALGYPSN